MPGLSRGLWSREKGLLLFVPGSACYRGSRAPGQGTRLMALELAALAHEMGLHDQKGLLTHVKPKLGVLVPPHVSIQGPRCPPA